MTTDTPTRPIPTTGTPPRRGRQLLIDLGLGVRLAVRSGRTGGLRLALTSIGVGLCVAVLLLGASLDRAQDRRQERADALNPMATFQVAAPPDAALFTARPYEQTYSGRMVSGMDLATTDPAAIPPPGVSTFPAPGTLVVSPALRDLLASPAGELLRPRFTKPVVGLISDDGLTSPSDLRFYRGVEGALTTDYNVFDPQSVGVAWGWGGPDWAGDGYTADRFIRVAVVTGAAVVLVPLLIFVALMARLGSATRNRRTAALRTIGATSGQLRLILSGETLVGAVAGVVVGAVLFVLVRRAAWLQVGGGGFFPVDIAPPWLPGAAIALGVPVIAAISVLLGSRTATTGRGRNDRTSIAVRTILALAVLSLLVGQIIGTPAVFGDGALIAVGSTVFLTLLLVPILLPVLLSLIVRVAPARGLIWQLAARRIAADVATSARGVAGISVVVAAGVAMLVMLAVTATTVENSHRGSVDPNRYTVRVDGATEAEVASTFAQVGDVTGVDSVTGASYLPMQSDPLEGGFGVTVVGCDQISAMGVSGCQDGDVFRVPENSATAEGVRSAVVPGSVLTSPVDIDGRRLSWTVPDTVRDISPPTGDVEYPTYLIATPGSLGSAADDVLTRSVLTLKVMTDAPDAVDELRNAVAAFGSRAAVESPTEWAADSSRVQLTSTLQTGLILGGGLTLAVALAGLLVVAIEQLVGRRRALTLTVAAGVPRSVLARSVLAGAAITGATGAVLGTAVGLLLAWYVSSILFTAVTLNALAVVAIAGAAVIATVLVTAATLPALSTLTRLESLRTE